MPLVRTEESHGHVRQGQAWTDTLPLLHSLRLNLGWVWQMESFQAQALRNKVNRQLSKEKKQKTKNQAWEEGAGPGLEPHGTEQPTLGELARALRG